MIHSNINISEPPKTLHRIKQSCLQNRELMLWILGHNRGLRIWLITYAHQLQLQYFQRSCTSFKREREKKTSGLKCSSCQRTQSHPHPYVCIIISCSCISGFWFPKERPPLPFILIHKQNVILVMTALTRGNESLALQQGGKSGSELSPVTSSV